jgi:hypothetical protein
MKKQMILTVMILIVMTGFWGCEEGDILSRVRGSGNVVDVEYTFDDFRRIDVSHAFDLIVVASDTFDVILMADDNLVKYLEVHQAGDWLYIGLENGHSYNNVNMVAEIRMPVIDRITASGASVVSMSGFSGTQEVENFEMELSGASVFSGNLDVDVCDIELSGASVLNINGNCSDLYLESSGACELNMGNFVCNTAYFNLSGASDGTVHVTGYLDVTLSGASWLRYYGNPEIGNMHITGASSLIKL